MVVELGVIGVEEDSTYIEAIKDMESRDQYGNDV